MFCILKYRNKLVSRTSFIDDITFQSRSYRSLPAHDEGMRTDRGGPLRYMAQRSLPHDSRRGGFSLGGVKNNDTIYLVYTM